MHVSPPLHPCPGPLQERAPYIVEMSNALIDEHDRPLSGLVSRGDELMAVDNVVVSSMTLPQVCLEKLQSDMNNESSNV